MPITYTCLSGSSKRKAGTDRTNIRSRGPIGYAHTLGRMTWWDFVTETAGTDNQSEIGRRLGITQPSVSQWKTSAPKKETVRRFADEYEVPVVRAFIAAGYFTEAEARQICD